MDKNCYLKIGFLLIAWLFFITISPGYAQIINKETNLSFLQQNATQLQQKIEASRNKAYAIAKEKGWETFTVTKRGEVIALQGVDDFGQPIYYITYNNSIAAATTNTNKLYAGGGLGLNLSGSTLGNGRAAIWDGGSILTTHVEFATNRIVKKDNASTSSTHATHVAGTMIAQGINTAAKGMAFALPQLFAFDFNSDVSEMSANAASLLISNHSYGTIAGWRFNDEVTPARWEFYGRPGENEDYKFGYYNTEAANWDQICYNAPYYLPVKSAGNNRSENGPAVGEPYYRYNASNVMANAGNRPAGIYNNDSYDIISTYGTAKNILTVGAVSPLPLGPTSTASIQLSSFSSWGPTDDGRIKPDLVADGVNVTSTSDASSTSYTTLSGTSMSTPNVSGSLLLLQELYSQRNAGAFLRAATLKGLVLGTATEAGTSAGPDYRFGWGLLNMEEAAKAILTKGSKSIIAENTLSQGSTQTVNIIASGNGPLIATICWTDPEAVPISAALALDNPTIKLINDLDIRISDGITTYLPWILDPANPTAAATTGDNFRDNMEQVYIANAIPGKSYTITITHKGTLSRGPQAFSLITTGVGGSNYCSSTPLSNADSKIINFKLANIDYTAPAGCTTYKDLTSQVVALEKGRTYPLNLSLGTCGANFDKIAKIFIDYNSDGDFDDSGELIATSQVVNAATIFTTNITVPDQVIVNTSSILRIVLTETNVAANVSACGNYNKGETQDYRVNFLMPSVDVGIKAIVSPANNSCSNIAQTVTVTLKNFGTQSQVNIPVTATIMDGSTTVATLTGNFNTTLSSLNEAELTLNGSFNALSNKIYTIIAKTVLAGDLVSGNDQVTGTMQTNNPPQVASASSYYCNDINAYSLNASGNGTIFWYKSANELNPIAFGTSTAIVIPPGDGNSYYAGINDFRSDLGPKNKSDLGEGGYNQFTPGITVETLVPMTLESAKLYIGNSGQVRFTVVNSFGASVSSVLLSVTATKSIPSAGVSANDINDQGQVYPLNLNFPAAGSYTINIEYLNGATIFRNNPVSTNYPYRTALDLFSITGNTATQDNSPNYFKTFYYYLYDLKVKASDCQGGIRLAAPLTTIQATQNGNSLSSNFAAGNQWLLNGAPIIGATNQQFTAIENGDYTVEVKTPSGCTMRSDVIRIGDLENKELVLKVYPVPTKGDLNIEFDIPQVSTVKVLLTNLLGQIIYTEEKLTFSGSYRHQFDLTSHPAGIYVLRIKVDGKAYSRKITLIR
jgi:hypothetical protein